MWSTKQSFDIAVNTLWTAVEQYVHHHQGNDSSRAAGLRAIERKIGIAGRAKGRHGRSWRKPHGASGPGVALG
jgi:hypothetical protein